MDTPTTRRSIGSITQITTEYTLSFPATVPEGYAVCTVCGEVMDREQWARTKCEPRDA